MGSSSGKQVKINLLDENVTKLYAKCPKHTKETVNAFCVPCDCLVCMACFLDNHKAHQICKISEIAQEKRTELVEMLNKISGVESKPGVNKQKSPVQGPTTPHTTADTQTSKQTQKHQELLDQNKSELVKLVVNNLQTLERNEQTQSAAFSDIRERICERATFLQGQLEERKAFLLSQIKTVEEQERKKLEIKREEMDLCVVFMDLYQTDQKFALGLEATIWVRILQILKSLKEESGQPNIDADVACRYVVDELTDVKSTVKNLLGDVKDSQEIESTSVSESDCMSDYVNASTCVQERPMANTTPCSDQDIS